MADTFDDVLEIEEALMRSGYAEGKAAGEQMGIAEGLLRLLLFINFLN